MLEKKQIMQDIATVLKEDEAILLLLSGGPDSVAVYHLLTLFFKEYNLSAENLHLLHADHKQRKESSDEACMLRHQVAHKITVVSYE